MHLETLELVNFCQHRHLLHNFSQGLTAVIGPNGSGKSNLLGAVRYALTGTIPNVGDKAENICQLAPPDEKSYVRMVFTHGLNTRLEVTRFLRPNTKTKLSVTHDPGMPAPAQANEHVHGDNAVNARIRELLGREFDTISDMVLVPQDQLFGFLDQIPSERAKSFQRLFRTEAAQSIHQALGTFLATVPQPGESTVDLARAQLEQAQTTLEGWEAAVAPLRPAATIQAERDNAVKVIGAYESRSGAASVIQQERQQLETLLNDLQMVERLRVTYSEQHVALQKQLAGMQSLSDQARAALTNLANYRKMDVARQQIREGKARDQAELDGLQSMPRPMEYQELTVRRTALQDALHKLTSLQAVLGSLTLAQAEQSVKNMQAELAALVPPVIPDAYLPVSEREQMVSQLGGALQRETEFLAAFETTGVAECPTCHTPAASLADRVAAVRAAMPTRIAEYANAKAFRDACERYDLDMSQYRVRREGLEQQLPYWQEQIAKLRQLPDLQQAHAQAQYVHDISLRYDNWMTAYNDRKTQLTEAIANWTRQEAALQTIDQPVANEAELNEIINNQTILETTLKTAERNVQTQQQEVSRLQGQIGQLRSSLAAREGTLAGLTEVTVAQHQQAVQAQALLDQELQHRQQSDTHLVTARQAVAYWQQQLAAAQTAEREALIVRAALGQLQSVRELFHHSNLPRFTAHRNLQRLQLRINDFLAMFSTDYRVQADEGLSFVANFPDGRRQPAERLSGGQKVILALAFRLAVNVMFAENVGMLALDEPTAFLDEHHIRGFEPVLARLREYSHSRGLQCVMITHERGLAPLFDAAITL
jgi:exonuclease SbcC